MLSGSGSQAWGRALLDFDLVWLYLLTLLAFGAVRATIANLRWLIRGLAVPRVHTSAGVIR